MKITKRLDLFSESMNLMNTFLLKWLGSQLKQLGVYPDCNLEINEIRVNGKINSMYMKWLNESLAILARNEESSFMPLDELVEEWDKKKKEWILYNPDLQSRIHLLEPMLFHLSDILSGAYPATDIMFPNGSMKLVENVYQNNPVADYFNDILSDQVVAYVTECIDRNLSARIRILEIGAGTGGTSEAVLSRLEPFQEYIEEYCYTDVSRAFLIHAQEKYNSRKIPMTYKLLNIEESVAAQNIDEGGFDLIIATNVLHATHNIRHTLRNVKACTSRNGWLLLNEVTANTLFTHLTFGLLEGWWMYEDTAVRIPGCPGLYPEMWEKVLHHEGFHSVTFPAAGEHRLGQQIIQAESDGVIRQKKQLNISLRSGQHEETETYTCQRWNQVPVATHMSQMNGGLFRQKSEHFFKTLIGKVFKIPPEQLDSEKPLADYGLDSILVVQVTSEFKKIMKNVSSTLFFEHSTIRELVDHFIRTREADLIALVGIEEEPKENQAIQNYTALKFPNVRIRANAFENHLYLPDEPDFKLEVSSNFDHEVAVIGLSGRYAQAKNINDFWNNIQKGKNCIQEIPQDRWNWADYFKGAKGTKGSIYTKWGGFIDDADKFDPLFFRISPREAELMDPQERIFLETVYTTIEDAGYTPTSLGEHQRVGVFVGIMNAHYPTGASYWSVANRISYTLDFRGPSLAVDTACSSSLTALHLAMESLRSGTSDCAIAGGVNLIVDPAHYLKLTDMNMLSTGKQCKSFGDEADGFVDGEGVGAVILKPLRRAVADGDHIYGIIRGSMLNSGGKTNGYTVPSPAAQSQVVSDALERAGIHPRSVSYVEAHGTGTALGDPIEIEGLKQAYEKSTLDKQFCSLGSVKSNIGHCESAAGIAALTKVLMQMKHGQLAPTLHSKTQNPEIPFEDTPFVLQQELAEWKRPQIEMNGTVKDFPRIAGISSFGAGGANAHVLVEEYIPQENRMDHFGAAPRTPVMIVLSGKDEQRLQEQVLQLLEAMEQGDYGDDRLESIAYTLQVGREAMEERLGLIVESVSDLAAQLREYAEHQKAGRWFRGNVKRYKETISALETDEDMQETIRQWIYKGKYAKLLDLWVKGLSMNWQALYGENRPCRISLPTYPFARDRYWVPQAEGKEAAGRSREDTDSRLHPLLHRNISVLSEQRYSSTFSGEEFFLTDHRVQGRKMLPGVAYLEMARTAVEQALEGKPGEWITLQLQQVTWMQPITVEEQPVEVRLRLMAGEEGDIGYEIYKGSTGAMEDVVYSQGTARVVTNVESVREDIAKRIAEHRAAGAQEVPITACYEAFAAMGIEYGAGQRSLESVQAGAGQVWARVSLPSGVSVTAHDYVLHPSLMDGALQAAIGLTLLGPQENTAGAPALPFSLRELTVYGPCTSQMWVHMSEEGERVQEERVQKRSVDVYDDTGRLCVSLRGFTSRLQGGGSRSLTQPLTYPLAPSEVEVAAENVIVAPVWEPCRITEEADPSGSAQSDIVLIGGSRERREAVMAYYPQAQVVALHAGEPVEDIQGKLEDCGSIRHVIWIGPEAEIPALEEKRIIEGQEDGVIQLFRLVKSMLQLGYGHRTLEWTVITVQAQPVNKYDEVDPTHASVHGFIGSMAKEYSHWKVRLADMEAGVEWPWSELLFLPPNAEGDGLVNREGEWYRQELVPVTMETGYPTRYRHGGVYVVIGGAGGLGTVWSEYMIRTYQAQIVWIGRRTEDEAIRGKRERLAEIGPEPMYIAADASDETALGEACRLVRQAYGDIHGVVHSAIVLSDRSLGQMEEEEFCKSLQAKVDVSVHLARAFQGEALDFVLFFSSFNAFTKAAGQSNYVSGCTFKDAFAHQLSVEWSCEVKVVNWGYWGQVGVVSGERYRKQMERLGIQSIRTEEGMRILEQLVSGQLHQLGVMRTTDPLGIKEVNWEKQIVCTH
ncbi:SDR family NAD(P)-dependent oxidoreductase [Paenibacillus sp. CMM36]